jgi:pimeloyl-ACP methyl ester carboxylesterase
MSAVPTFLAAGEGAPDLVLLHGIGGAAAAFAPQLRHLAGSFRCTAWNMPGYADSPPLEPMTFPGLAAALLRLLDHRRIARAHLVGHSLGGMVAQELAASAPERVASLVLSATSPAFGSADGDFQRAFLAPRLGPLDAGRTMAELAPEIVASLVGEGADPAGVELAQRGMAAVPETVYRAALRCLVSFDRRDALPNYRMPVLLIAGERDASAPAAMMRRMAGRIPGARFAVIAGAGHLANLERPESFNRLLDDFLSRHAKA